MTATLSATAKSVPAITAVILAGGSGSRLGGVDKALLQWRGQSFIELIVERIAPQIPLKRAATPEDIMLVHGEGHFEHVARTRGMPHYAFDADTPVSARSFDTACLAVGGVLSLCDEVVAGRVRNGFAPLLFGA